MLPLDQCFFLGALGWVYGDIQARVVVDAVKKLCEGRRFHPTSAPAIFKAVSSTMDVSHVAFRRALWDAQKLGLLSSRKPHGFFYRQVSHNVYRE